MLSLTLPSLSLTERPTPDPGAGEIRVRVRAAALNRADLLQRRGGYPAPPGWPEDIPGLEYTGEVEALGPGAARWKVGDRVMGLVGGGGQAECVVVHEDEALPVPAALDWVEAAAIPEAFLTAWDALVVRGRLVAGERVLIHAAGSGVGTAASAGRLTLAVYPHRTSRYELHDETGTTEIVSEKTGDYDARAAIRIATSPAARDYLLRVAANYDPSRVTLDGTTLARCADQAELDAGDCSWLSNDGRVVVKYGTSGEAATLRLIP